MSATKSLGCYGSLEKFLIVWGLITAEEHGLFKGWYRRAQSATFNLAATFGIDRWVASQVVSAVSPAVDWDVNIRYAAKTVEAWQTYGDELDRLLFFSENSVGAPYGWENFRKAWRILDGDQEIAFKGSPKTGRFAHNIFTPYMTRLVTVDSHMARMWCGSAVSQVGSARITEKQYLTAEADVQRLADIEGITPEQCQEELWQKHLKMIRTNTLPHDLGLDW
jgi:hypothetical protein